jgi:hypothetical protein
MIYLPRAYILALRQSDVLGKLVTFYVAVWSCDAVDQYTSTGSAGEQPSQTSTASTRGVLFSRTAHPPFRLPHTPHW